MDVTANINKTKVTIELDDDDFLALFDALNYYLGNEDFTNKAGYQKSMQLLEDKLMTELP